MPYDQSSWRQATTWSGPLPSSVELWNLLSSSSLPHPFEETLDACAAKAGFLKKGKSGAQIPLLSRDWSIRFTNLVSGRFTELVFERTFRPVIEQLDISWIEETTARNFVDYRIFKDEEGFALAINVKNAGVQYRKSKEWVGLEPEDTLPIATYKIFGSEVANLPQLLYVYLVDWSLMSRLRESYWDQILTPKQQRIFQLIACVKGMPRRLEEAFITATISERLEDLLRAVGYSPDKLEELPFRAVSGARCRRIFFQQHERSPYVYRQRMNTDPNVHISVEKETIHLKDFVEKWLRTSDKRAELLRSLANRTTVEVPDPAV